MAVFYLVVADLPSGVFYLADYIAVWRGRWTPDKDNAIRFGNQSMARRVARRVGCEARLED